MICEGGKMMSQSVRHGIPQITEGCVLPSVKHQTCRECAVALLAQLKEHDCKFEILKKDEENMQLKQIVKDLEETLSRIQEENLRLVCELKKCQEHLQSKDRELQRQASELQKKRREYHQDRRDAEEKIRHLKETVKSLEDSHINMVDMAVNRELQLQDSQQAIASKDREICTLQFELSKLQEQRAVKNLMFLTEPGGSRHLQHQVREIEVSISRKVKDKGNGQGAGARGASAGEVIKR